MSKNIVIQEGGEGRQFTADKLKTALVGGGSCLWIPEDEANLGTKSITEDGTYEASADGLYGFSSVTVRGIGKVTGRDPVTGEETQITTKKDPQTGEDVIETKVIPSYALIARSPDRLTYNDGDLIDFTGMVVKLYLKSLDPFTDDRYPDSIIPDSELDKPVKVAHGGGTGTGYHPNVSSAGTFLGEVSNSYGGRSYTKYNDDPAFCIFRLPNGGYAGPILISTTYNGAAYITQGQARYPSDSLVLDGVQYYINKEWHLGPAGEGYFYNTWRTPFMIVDPYDYVSSGSVIELWRYIYSNGIGESPEIPVVWVSPYNNKAMTDSFTITVNPAPEPEPGEGSATP